MPIITTRDRVEIFYKDWGSGQPIVFSHGWWSCGTELRELRELRDREMRDETTTIGSAGGLRDETDETTTICIGFTETP
jgi:pimeloyl-ACP methyl ester carboxylesterase